jgi:hypothetical protein
MSCRHPKGCDCSDCKPRSLHVEMDDYNAEFDLGVQGVRAEMDRVAEALNRRVKELLK